MLRRGRKEKTSDRIVNSSLVVYDKPWYSASCNLGPPRGKSFQGSVGPYNRNTSSSSSNDTVRPSTGNGTPVTRRSGRPVSQQGDRQKRAVSGSGRCSKTQEPGSSQDRELTPRSAGEKALRSILKHERNTMRPKSSHDLSPRKQLPDDDNRRCASPTSTYLFPSRQQSGQKAAPAALPPPPPLPFRQSRIPRCTYLNSNGDVREERTKLPARSQSSNEWCRGRPKFSRQSLSPTRRETAAGAKKTSDAKERPAKREWVGIGGGKCDWGLAAGSSRSVPGYDPVGSTGNRRSESSDSNYDRKASRRHSENDVRRNNRRSPRMDEDRCLGEFQNARSSWSSHIDIVTVNPSPQQLSPTIGHHMTTPRSLSSDNSSSNRPYYRRVYDWLTNFADAQWSNLKLIKRVATNYVVPVTMKAKRTASYPDRLQCSKSNHLTTYSGSQTSPSVNNSSSNAPANLAEQTPGFASTICCRSRTSSCEQQEQYPSLRGAQLTPEEKWSAIKKQQQQNRNPGDPKQSNSRSELKSSTSEGQSSSHSHSRTSSSCAAGGRPSSNLTTCSSAMELAGSRLDRMQESAADAITQMRGPEFVIPRKLLKSETLLTNSLTKEFEDTANMPSTCRRTAQFRKLLSELPAENYYVVEWLVTNNIVNESNASRFGHLFKVKPNVLEVLTRHRDLLFPTAV